MMKTNKWWNASFSNLPHSSHFDIWHLLKNKPIWVLFILIILFLYSHFKTDTISAEVMVVVSVMCGGWVVTCHVTQACVTRVCSWQSWHGACPVSPGTHQHATCLIMFTLDTPATMFSDWFDICRGSMLLVCSVEQNAFYSVFRCHCEEIEWKNRGFIRVCV